MGTLCLDFFVNKNLIITFHLSLISDDEEKRIVSRKLKYFKYSSALKEAENNYALSICHRTSFIAKLREKSGWDFPVNTLEWYQIKETDLWQEKIIQNYKELAGRFQYPSDFISDIGSSDIEILCSSCSDTGNK